MKLGIQVSFNRFNGNVIHVFNAGRSNTSFNNFVNGANCFCRRIENCQQVNAKLRFCNQFNSCFGDDTQSTLGTDEDFKSLVEAASECGKPGHIAYRHCKYCGKYEILVDYQYVDALESDIFLSYMDHDYHCTDNGDGTHTVECSRCHDKYTEDCTYIDDICTKCGGKKPVEPTYVIGDVDGDGEVSDADAIYLLYCTLFGEEDYPLNQPADFDGSGTFDDADAVYLLYYTLFGEEDFPLSTGLPA